MEPIIIVAIIIIFFAASFMNSITGGSGLITIPTLIFMGLSPHVALGTGKVEAFGSTSGAALGYGRNKKIDYRTAFILIAFAIVGGIAGTFTILSIPEQIVKKFIGVAMICISLFLLMKKEAGIATFKGRRNVWLLIAYGLLSGFFTGLYGVGMGTINRLVLSSIFAYSIINSSAISAFVNSVINLVSLFIFFINGAVQTVLIIPILSSALLGGYLGSKYAIRMGNFNFKNVLIAVSLVMAAALLIF